MPMESAVLAWAQAGAMVADTVITIQAASTGLQRWVDLLTSIASIVIAVALIAIAIPVIPAAWNSRKMYRRMNKVIERLQQDVNPILRHAHDAVDNVNYITTSVRTDVEQFRGTIDRTQQRLNHAAELAEERINRFNALLQVVQEEAEGLFVDTASTLRGVKAGTQALQRFRAEEEEEDWLQAMDEDESASERRTPRRREL